MVSNCQIILSLLCTAKLFQAVLSSDIPEISETLFPSNIVAKTLSDDGDLELKVPSSTRIFQRPKSHYFHSTRGLQNPLLQSLETKEGETLVNNFDGETLIDNCESDDNGDSDDSWASSSVVSEVFLEEMGLRNSRSSTPSMHSPSPSIRPQSSPLSLSRLILCKTINTPKSVSSSSDDDDFEDIAVNQLDSDDSSSGSEIETYDINSVFPENNVATETVPGGVSLIERQEDSSVTSANSYLTTLPDIVLAHIMEYCSDDNLLQSRQVDRMLNRACDSFLNFMTISTVKPPVHSNMFTSLFEKYSLASTMMPFYRKQAQIRETLNNLLSNNGKSWHLMTLYEIHDFPEFVNLSIFSDAFISEILIPRLKVLPQNSPNQPSSLFLLGEALLKSKRFELFNSALLPVLNALSVQLFADIAVPPNNNLISPGFLTFELENQIVLGSTLHMAINLNLSQTVYQLIRLQPSIIRLKNHVGRTALLQIISNLWKWQSSIPGPQLDEDLDGWMDEITAKFISGQSIQTEFIMNSRLLIEMFLGIIGQIRAISSSSQEAVEAMGFNEEFEVYELVRTTFYKHKATLLQELVSAQQYDLIISIGFYYGDFISNQEEINPLYVAAEKNNPTITGLLLKFFPAINVNQLTKSGCSAVGLAVSGKNFDALRVLLNDPRIDPNLHQSVSPLIQSIEFCPIEIVNLLLTHPAIELHHQILRHRKTVSPVERAVHLRKWRVLQSLLSHPNHNYEQDYSAFVFLGEAEKRLNPDDHYDLLQLIRKVILPTIPE